MPANVTTSPAAIAQEVVFNRVLSAPRSLVFKMWTQAEHFGKWWGPKYFTTKVRELDARPGGRIRAAMHGPNDMVFYLGGNFEEVDEPNRLVFITTALPGEEGEPYIKIRNVVDFDERDGKTILTMRATVIMAPSEEAQRAVAGMETGLSQTLDRLSDQLARLTS